MDLCAYPRPKDDTGIGIHWCAGISGAAPEVVEDFWLPELMALGVKWVKIADHLGALPLAEALLAAEIMPVVQIVRREPGPGQLSTTELVQVEQFIRAGVRYFEFNSEPDRVSSWQKGKLPADALTITAQNAVTDMQAILARGGLPAVPALTPQSDWQLAKEIHRIGGDALFDSPIWLAIHNYSSNRPLEYPRELGHIEGAPLTQELYYTLAQEARGEDPWQGRGLAEINDLRRRVARPSRGKRQLPLGLPSEQVHWRAFEILNEQVRGLLGRSLPILSTANGYLIGENADPRYPTTTFALHMAQTLEICRAMMGTSSRTLPVPDYYFCTAFWLLANEALESDRSVGEHNTWYRSPHSLSVLPIVQALKQEPKQPRSASSAASMLPTHGQVDDQDFRVERKNQDISVNLDEKPSVLVGYARPTGHSLLSGQVQGGASAELRLVHNDGFAYESMAGADGSYRFVDLPAGRYSLEVTNPAGSRVDGIDLPAATEVTVPLSAYGWGFEIKRQPMKYGGMLTCGVKILPGSSAGTPVLQIRGDGQESRVVPLVRSNQPLLVQCEVGPLPSGDYQLDVLGLSAAGTTPISCQVHIGRGTTTDVLFVYSFDEPEASPSRSVIHGTVQGGANCTLRLCSEDGSEWLVEPDEIGHYAFKDLPAATYFLDVKYRQGHILEDGMVQRAHLPNHPGPLVLDGQNQVHLDLFLAPDAFLSAPAVYAVLRGSTAPGTIEQVSLLDEQGQRYVAHVSQAGEFQFDCLLAGNYDLYADGFVRRGIHLAAGDRLTFRIPRTGADWSSHTRIHTDSRTPGLIRVQWLGRSGLPVSVESGDSGMEERRTTGENGSSPYAVQFGPFPPGLYRIRAEGLPVTAEVRMAAEEAAAVTFVRGTNLSI